MIANFHTHTVRCHHAHGDEREYIETAISNGLKVLGFSDHAPYIFSDGYYSGFRMTPEESVEYIENLSALREEYKDKIKIYIGYEMEYYAKYFDKTIEMMKNSPCEYIILGQHYIGNEIGCRASVSPSDSEADLHEYVDIITSAIDTGLFFYVAHPDVLNFTGDIDVYRSEMERLCKHAKKADIPLEINLLGIREGRFYPKDEFWKIAGEVGNDAILGCDAHRPCDVGDESNIQAGVDIAKKYGLRIIEATEPKFLK